MSQSPPDGDKPPHSAPTAPSSGWFQRFLAFVEWLGNLLPHPVSLFALFAFGVVIVSGIAAWATKAPSSRSVHS